MSPDGFQSKTFHEIKNSITILNSTISLIEKSHPEIVDYPYWFELKSETKFLRNIIADYGQIRNHDLSLEPTSVDSIVERLQRRLRSVEEEYHFHFIFALAEDLPDMYTDEYRLKSTIINLLKNSFEAMNHVGTVFINIFQDDEFIRVDIQDFGGGIAPEVASKMYDPDFTTKESGTGLGLSISRQFITEIGGILLHTSRPGDGTTFTIKIPIYSEQTTYPH